MKTNLLKHALTGAFCFFTVITIGQQNKSFVIRGNISGLTEDKNLYLILNQKKDTIATTHTQKGAFIFKGNLSSDIEWASLRIENAYTWPTFFLENKTLSIHDSIQNWSNAKVIGSKESYYLYDLKKVLQTLRDQLDDVIKLTANDSIETDKTLKLRNNIQDSISIVKQIFVNQHPDSKYTAWLIQNSLGYNLSQQKNEYEKLTLEVKQSNFGAQLKGHITALVLRDVIKKGGIAPDFKVQTPEGKIFSLHEVTSKNILTLIDFWASWCKPCRATTPELKKTYTAFKDKGFMILSISSDKNKEAWLKAIKEDDINWTNAKANESSENPFAIFDIQAIPAFILVDQAARIIAIYSSMSSIPSFGFKEAGNELYLYETVKEIIEH